MGNTLETVNVGRHITIDDILNFVSRNRGRSFPTIGGRSRFTIELSRTGVKVTPDGKDGNILNRIHIQNYLDVFNTTHSLKTTQYPSSNMRNSSYLLTVLRELQKDQTSPIDIFDLLTDDEKEIISAPKTEQQAIRMSRVGQGKFRSKLIELRLRCYVTGVADERFLRASHIKPWSESNNFERLDPHNGLLLCPNYDHFFDNGFLSFAANGEILISTKIPDHIIRRFDINKQFRGENLGEETDLYLAYHREKLFKG